MKTCTKCETLKPLDNFHKKRAAKDGRTARCKECLAAQNAEYRVRKPYGNHRTRVPDGARFLRCAFLVGRRTRAWCSLYIIWRSMRERCLCETYHVYKDYGAKGVTICDEWSDFAVFREWAVANGFRKGLTLDRIRNSEGYSPNNCRWADRETQTYNSSQTEDLTFRGVTKPGPVWAKEHGLTPSQLRQRLRSGWSLERALTEPIKAEHAGPKYALRKISDEQIRWARSCNLAAKEVASELGLSLTYTRRIIRGVTHPDVQ